MNWQQKLMALKALTSTHLEMREPGNWFVAAYARSIEEKSTLVGRYGNGKTPAEAVNQDFDKMTAANVVVVVESGVAPKRRVRWNGFMWEDAR